MPRIALIHAVQVAMSPIEAAFRDLWPAAERVNLLDDALSVDRARQDELSPELHARIVGLGRYALALGADAVLYTCSAFGPAIETFAAGAGRPVLKPNEAMFRAALAASQRIGGQSNGGLRIGMLTTFEPSVASMEEEFGAMATAERSDARIEVVLVADAMAALKVGDAATHNRLLAEAATRLAHCDAIMLAQFSTSIAQAAVERAVSCPVLTSPHAAVHELKARLKIGA